MGRKKTSTNNTSTPANHKTDQADQASISTYSSDTASVPLLDRSPPAVSDEDPIKKQQYIIQLLEDLNKKYETIESRLTTLERFNLPESQSHIPSVQDIELPSTLHSSDSTPLPSSNLSSNYRLTILESNVGDFNWDHVKQTTVADLYSKFDHHKQSFNGLHESFFNFKKDVRDFLGLDTPARLKSSDDDPDLPVSFRHVLEKITNPLEPLPNHHFQTFLSNYTKWQLYRGRGGVISLYGYIQTSPNVYAIYLAKARSQDPSFQFTKLQDNALFFNQLIDFVFFPTGFDISAFEILIKEKRMKQFSIALAGQYAFDVDVIVHALSTQIVSLNSSDLWRVVATYVSPPPFQKFIMNRVPPSPAKFLSYLDQFAKLYDQRVAMDYEIRRSTDFQDTSTSPHSSPYQQNPSSRPQANSPPPRKVNQLTRDSIHPLAWQHTNPCPIDQLCHNCMEVGLHLPANCPDLLPSSEQRNVNAVYTSSPSYSSDALRDFTSFDNDHTMEDNP